MTLNRLRLMLGTTLGLALGLAWIGWVAADDAKETTPPKDSSGLVSPEFEEHLDVDAASIALREEDDTALLGIAEKLGAGERAVGKPNPKLPSARLFHAAIQAAYNKGDQKLLGQAEAAIKASKSLKDTEKADFLKKIELMKKGGAAGRKIDAGPGLKPNEVSAESVSLYNTFKNEIRTTQDYGAEAELDPLADGIKQLSEFHPKQREHLMKLIGEARSVIKERGEADPALAKLASASRTISGGTSDVRIIGPDYVTSGGVVVLGVIPVSAAGSRAGQVVVRTDSPGIQILDNKSMPVTTLTLPWNGKSQSVRVKITAPPPKRTGFSSFAYVPPVAILFGMNKSSSGRWSAIPRP